jgi:hypothetical protein
MKRKKAPINYSKERVVLSDLLPYETPLTFSNRAFYRWLLKNRIETSKRKGSGKPRWVISWKNRDAALFEVIKLIFNLRADAGMTVNDGIAEVSVDNFVTIPYRFSIAHKLGSPRVLSLIHPKNQLKVVEFYQRYKHLILYYCNVSPYSIRRPARVARFVFHRDSTHALRYTPIQELDSLELEHKEYENLKSFFVYEEVDNVYKFYESDQYHQLEKQYSSMVKFDVARCFDSIYTHTLPWALLSKEDVKAHLKESKKTFGGEFDNLMQELNYNETNGIIIGPELSRLFAEMILQRVDLDVSHTLATHRLKHERDYRVARYVDDYFVFYNDGRDRKRILEVFERSLADYKLFLNHAKTAEHDKPIITGVSMAKQRIVDLLDATFAPADPLRAAVKQSDGSSTNDSEHGLPKMKALKAQTLITQLKSIIKEAEIEYADILNFTLSILDRKMSQILKHYAKAETKEDTRGFAKLVSGTLDVAFFLYAVSPRVNSTIRLCRILRRVIEELKSKETNLTEWENQLITKLIADEIRSVLLKNRTLEHEQVETLYLLLVLRELGKEYWLGEETLLEYFAIVDRPDGLHRSGGLGYFGISVLLFYIGSKKRYSKLRTFVKEEVLRKLVAPAHVAVMQRAENVLLLFDCLACPHLELPFKRKLLIAIGVTDPALQDGVIQEQSGWSTTWTDFELGRALDAKLSQEVY